HLGDHRLDEEDEPGAEQNHTAESRDHQAPGGPRPCHRSRGEANHTLRQGGVGHAVRPLPLRVGRRWATPILRVGVRETSEPWVPKVARRSSGLDPLTEPPLRRSMARTHDRESGERLTGEVAMSSGSRRGGNVYREPGSAAADLFERARRVLPGGNTRTTVYSAPYPPYAARGRGAVIVDADGEERFGWTSWL